MHFLHCKFACAAICLQRECKNAMTQTITRQPFIEKLFIKIITMKQKYK